MRGVGYYVKDLKRHLRQILGLDRKLRVAVMGAGNLGLALADYPGFRREGFEIVALFDVADAKIGDESRSGVPIFDIRELKRVVRKERIDIAVIAVPAESAHPVLEQVVAAGIKAVLNFSPGTLKAPPGVKLKSVDLTVSLESLSFYLAQGIDTTRDWRTTGLAATRTVRPRLTHVDADGRVRMVDVGDKAVTAREAVARGDRQHVGDRTSADPARGRSRKATRCRPHGWPASWPPSGRPI